MVVSMDRIVGIRMGDNLGRDMGLVGDMVMRFFILGHLYLRDILVSSWFQLLWPCHIEDNLKY